MRRHRPRPRLFSADALEALGVIAFTVIGGGALFALFYFN